MFDLSQTFMKSTSPSFSARSVGTVSALTALAADPSSAAVVLSSVENLALGSTTSVDVDNDGQEDFEFLSAQGLTVSGKTTEDQFLSNDPPSGTVRLFTPGEALTISLSGDDAVQSISRSSPSNYAGFRFDNASGTHLGWVEFAHDGLDSTIIRMAWESEPETSIEVGAVPETSTLGLATLGGCLLWSRRRKPGRHA